MSVDPARHLGRRRFLKLTPHLLAVLITTLLPQGSRMSSERATDLVSLNASAAWINARFERNGAHLDREGRVTSEAQSYALLRAVWLNQRALFERAWHWTQANLLQPNGLPAWLWQNGVVVDGSSAADADTDIALALLLAGRRWQAPQLIEMGTHLVQSIWAHEVAELRGQPYLAAGPWAVQPEQLIINPSYFAPYAYRIFQQVDSQHPWQALLDAGYLLIEHLSSASLAGEQPVGLPPDWIALRRSDGELAPANLGTRDTTLYSYDAPRLYWRVAIDLDWSADLRAQRYLNRAGFLHRAVRRGGLAASYARDGAVVELGATGVGLAGAFAALRTLDRALAERLYVEQLVATAHHSNDKLWWDKYDDLYRQEWAWFTVALHAEALQNFWRNDTDT